MYKLERIQRRAIRVLYKVNLASEVSISALMISLGLILATFANICYCVLRIKLHTSDLLNI